MQAKTVFQYTINFRVDLDFQFIYSLIFH